MLAAVQISAIAPTSAVGRADSMLAETGDVKNPVVTEMWKDGWQSGNWGSSGFWMLHGHTGKYAILIR
jgi:hypothetical protein